MAQQQCITDIYWKIRSAQDGLRDLSTSLQHEASKELVGVFLSYLSDISEEIQPDTYKSDKERNIKGQGKVLPFVLRQNINEKEERAC